jgi:hypothetical protein
MSVSLLQWKQRWGVVTKLSPAAGESLSFIFALRGGVADRLAPNVRNGRDH